MQADHSYITILSEFPPITKQFSKSIAIKHDVVHYITITGTSCNSKQRRLPPDKLAIAKSEFKIMIELGICRTSSSSWSSTLHLMEKADGAWRL